MRWRPLLTVVLLLVLLSAPAAGAAEIHRSEAGASTTNIPKPAVVSIMFDDGWKSQAPAAAVLTSHGMRGTFFVSSGMWTYPAFLSRSQIIALAAQGHEIGGHSLTDPHFAGASSVVRRREICQDRANLLELKTPVTSFAYPYGYVDRALKSTVETCGYTSGRIARGLADRPPADLLCDCVARLPFNEPRWAVPVKPTVKSDVTAAILERWVRQAEQSGGWVPIVFHRICDGCANESTSLRTFTEFVDWLATRPASTRIETYGDVVNAVPFAGQIDRRTDELPIAQSTAQAVVPPARHALRPRPDDDYAFYVGGQGIGQAQIVMSFLGVTLLVSVLYRVLTRRRRMT
jgi:peptidoglycan/xylan/chitin deacetylase (PgdA/CDA1 family)